ncbi:acid phosphatase protein [Stemphylium lycopersici]|nr:acid phosphatase protein [Stemphylium lycopersici]RAR10091.1 acid phosphatase protein [Stemphylium lycopersici]
MNTQGIRFCQQWNHDYASDDGTASVLLVVQAAPQRNKSRTFTTQRNTTTSRSNKLDATQDVVAKSTSSRSRSKEPKPVHHEHILHPPVGADPAPQWLWPKGCFDNTLDELTERNQKELPLLRFPAGLRLAIYEFSTGGGLIQIQDVTRAETPKQTANLDSSAAYGPDMGIFDPKSKPLRPASGLLGLRYACRQTRAKTRLQFFNENSFGGGFEMHGQDAKEVPQAFTMEQSACVKEVFFRIYNLTCLSDVEPVTDGFPNVNRFIILEKPIFVNSVGFWEYKRTKKKAVNLWAFKSPNIHLGISRHLGKLAISVYPQGLKIASNMIRADYQGSMRGSLMSPMSYQQLPKLQNTVEVDPLNEDYDPPSLPHQNYEEIRDFGFNQTRPLTPVGPRAIKHAAHWSSSTNTTAVTSETSSQQSGRKAGSSRARTWAFEMMAIAISLGAVASIIGVVFRYNGRALPDWPHDITLNALIALLATFANAAILLGSFGAIVAIVGLALGPFAQQIATYKIRSVESNIGAVIPRALNYTGALPGDTSTTGFVPILPLKAAVYNGLFAENNRPAASLQFECKSGNCVWEPFESLAVCHECADITSLITRYCPSELGPSPNMSSCGWQVPQGAHLNTSSDVFSMTSFIPSAYGDMPHSTMIRLIFMGTELHDTPDAVNPWATQCTLQACVNTFSAAIVNGTHQENTTHSVMNHTLLDMSSPDPEGDYGVYITGDSDDTPYLVGMGALLSIRGWFSAIFTNGSATRTTSDFTRSVTDPDRAVVVNLTVGISSGETFFDTDIVTAFYWNYYEYADGLNMLMSDLAISMTTAFRGFNGAVPENGKSITTESLLARLDDDDAYVGYSGLEE